MVHSSVQDWRFTQDPLLDIGMTGNAKMAKKACSLWEGTCPHYPFTGWGPAVRCYVDCSWRYDLMKTLNILTKSSSNPNKVRTKSI